MGQTEVLQPRGVTGHGVVRARDIEHLVTVVVVVLVEAGTTSEVGAGGVGSDGPLPEATHGWGVVRHGAEGSFAQVEVFGCHIHAKEEGRLLKVTVGDIPVGIIPGDEAGLDVRREWDTAKVGGLIV